MDTKTHLPGYLSNRHNLQKIKVVGSGLGTFRSVQKSSWPIEDHPLTDTQFFHMAWKCKPSQPIGHHQLWPCPLQVVSNFVSHSFGVIDDGSPLKTIHCWGSPIYGNPQIFPLSTFINHHEPYNRRKFRSQTSDNMDRWKSRGVKSPGGEDKNWEDQRRERERRKKMQVCEKVGSRDSLCFPNDLGLWKVEK